MKYLMLMIGSDYGCRNINYEILEAKDIEDAIKLAWIELEGYGDSKNFEEYRYDGTTEIEKVIITEMVPFIEIDVSNEIAEAWKKYENSKKNTKKYKEYIEAKNKYESLKEEFEEIE